jgi:hypothetical protein
MARRSSLTTQLFQAALATAVTVGEPVETLFGGGQ